MVVGYFNFVGVPTLPDKTDAPLVVDSDTKLTFAVAFELLQPVGGWDSEIIEVPGVIYHA